MGVTAGVQVCYGRVGEDCIGRVENDVLRSFLFFVFWGYAFTPFRFGPSVRRIVVYERLSFVRSAGFACDGF